MKITKAVIPAAGLGTRMLPATKALPKELLPVVDKPAIQYIVEEAVAAGIKQILIIIGEHKYSIIDHFAPMPELEARLEASGQHDLLKLLRQTQFDAQISFIKQPDGVRGTGAAMLCAREFADGDPVAVLYGDDVIIGDNPAIGQLMRAYEEYGLGTVGVGRVSDEDVMRYCSLAVKAVEGTSPPCYRVSDMIEKPARGQILSNYAILGRCILPYEIFSLLDETPVGTGGELQLTDAMAKLARSKGMLAVEYSGRRYDMGSKLGFMQAAVDVALAHPLIGADFAEYLKSLK